MYFFFLRSVCLSEGRGVGGKETTEACDLMSSRFVIAMSSPPPPPGIPSDLSEVDESWSLRLAAHVDGVTDVKRAVEARVDRMKTKEGVLSDFCKVVGLKKK